MFAAFIRAFFEGQDPKLLDQITEKENSIAELNHKIRNTQEEYSNILIQLCETRDLYEKICYNRKYQENLQTKLHSLFEAQLEIASLLEDVPWHRIINPAESCSEQQEQNELMKQEMLTVYERMEKRQVLIDFRQEQKSYKKLVASIEAKSLILSKRRKRDQLKINEALDKRNRLIVKLVMESKELENLRSKLREKDTEMKASKSLQGQSRPINNTENVKESVHKSTIVKIQDAFQPTKPLFKFRFDHFNITAIDTQFNNINKPLASSASMTSDAAQMPHQTSPQISSWMKNINAILERMDNNIKNEKPKCETYQSSTANEKQLKISSNKTEKTSSEFDKKDDFPDFPNSNEYENLSDMEEEINNELDDVFGEPTEESHDSEKLPVEVNTVPKPLRSPTLENSVNDQSEENVHSENLEKPDMKDVGDIKLPYQVESIVEKITNHFNEEEQTETTGDVVSSICDTS